MKHALTLWVDPLRINEATGAQLVPGQNLADDKYLAVTSSIMDSTLNRRVEKVRGKKVAIRRACCLGWINLYPSSMVGAEWD